MTLTEQILTKYKEKCLGRDLKASDQRVIDFIKSAITLTREECAKTVEGMKKVEKTRSDDWSIQGACGGNYDDAYYMGCDDGNIQGFNQALSDAASKIREIK